ncbi:MAG: hypothetical protein ABIJ92_01480 [Candidatus Aenigmatarchaeota archaeon]
MNSTEIANEIKKYGKVLKLAVGGTGIVVDSYNLPADFLIELSEYANDPESWLNLTGELENKPVFIYTGSGHNYLRMSPRGGLRPYTIEKLERELDLTDDILPTPIGQTRHGEDLRTYLREMNAKNFGSDH